MQFREGYREHFALRDGTRCVLRLGAPDMRPLLERGMARLSPTTRYQRFLSARSSFSDAELRYLTDIDNVDHVAIAAIIEHADGPEGIGVARFIRVADDPTVAEPAVVVLDDYQSRGLGRALLERLALAARERGVERFRGEILASNRQMLRLLRELTPRATFTPAGETVLVDVPVSDPDAADGSTSLRRLLASIASGEVAVRDIAGRLRLLKDHDPVA